MRTTSHRADTIWNYNNVARYKRYISIINEWLDASAATSFLCYLGRWIVGWLERFGEMSVNGGRSKEANKRKETSVKYLRAVVDCASVLGTIRLVEFQSAINPQRLLWVDEKLTMGTLINTVCGWLVMYCLEDSRTLAEFLF
ncbi:hypothetical protein AVEN_53430-1 [Araneus ventricosus]|uniref:Uncharacterized protein n=1 Tax=Araneus ventricosus TaxID=182803 RepID=A0A4Y2ACS4_ARAVE|nr:hypothetical protein AVEN_53430-1 [Araneus ventricosus]